MTKKKKPTAAKKQEILVNVILDRSGSMSSCREGTISGYNEYINGLRADKKTNYAVSLIQFDTDVNGPALTVSYENKPLKDVVALDAKGYEPRGMTPLYDAVGECIRNVKTEGAVIVVIITDGQENASREFTKDAVKALVKEKEAAGWTFAFLGANIDSYAVGGGIGMSAMNTSNYTVGNEQLLYSNLAAATVMRSANINTMGIIGASKTAFVDEEMRCSLQGGRPAVPLTFPKRTKLSSTKSSS